MNSINYPVRINNSNNNSNDKISKTKMLYLAMRTCFHFKHTTLPLITFLPCYEGVTWMFRELLNTKRWKNRRNKIGYLKTHEWLRILHITLSQIGNERNVIIGSFLLSTPFKPSQPVGYLARTWPPSTLHGRSWKTACRVVCATCGAPRLPRDSPHPRRSPCVAAAAAAAVAAVAVADVAAAAAAGVAAAPSGTLWPRHRGPDRALSAPSHGPEKVRAVLRRFGRGAFSRGNVFLREDRHLQTRQGRDWGAPEEGGGSGGNCSRRATGTETFMFIYETLCNAEGGK